MKAHINLTALANIKIQPLTDALSEILSNFPTAKAVVQGDDVRSYVEIINSAQTIATQLSAAGINPGHRIALDMPRGIELYEILLACVFAEVAFMSLPRGFGFDEKIKVAQRSKCVGIISDEIFDPSESCKINIHTDLIMLVDLSIDKDKVVNQSCHEIYCVRTSGTTGDPKVVPINSDQLSEFLVNARNALSVSKYATWSWMHDLSFDYAIWEIFGCITSCGCLVVIDEKMKNDTRTALHQIEKSSVNILSVTPSEFKYLFLEMINEINIDNFCLTDVLLAGERLSGSTLLPLFNELDKNGVRLINVYGPTEVTVFCSYHYITESDLSLESIPIGRPFPEIEFKLLSEEDSTVGELLISGKQVFDGYDGAQKLSNGYHSGDICKLDSEGRYVFIGRSSGYQKVNGYRVEPYEVEEHLQSHAKVDEAVVFVVNSNDQTDFLQAYIRVSRSSELSTRELRFLCSSLPPYLRPNRYVLIDAAEWPINDRGKTDRISLRRKVHDYQ